jgi:hypothetical protein
VYPSFAVAENGKSFILFPTTADWSISDHNARLYFMFKRVVNSGRGEIIN